MSTTGLYFYFKIIYHSNVREWQNLVTPIAKMHSTVQLKHHESEYYKSSIFQSPSFNFQISSLFLKSISLLCCIGGTVTHKQTLENRLSLLYFGWFLSLKIQSYNIFMFYVTLYLYFNKLKDTILYLLCNWTLMKLCCLGRDVKI